MSNPIPPFFEVHDCPGNDYAAKWKNYIEELYRIYIQTVVRGGLGFRGSPLRMQFRPETLGKHHAFWHLMQEGRVEDSRNPDLERCRRIRWIAWVINAAKPNDVRIRVFRQQPRHGENPWALWFHEQNYVVILWERTNYYLLKTAFMVKPHKVRELERDWIAHKKTEAATE